MKFAAAIVFLALPTAVHAADGNSDAGAMVFKKCAACHNVDEPINKVGPHLVGIISGVAGKPRPALPIRAKQMSILTTSASFFRLRETVLASRLGMKSCPRAISTKAGWCSRCT